MSQYGIRLRNKNGHIVYDSAVDKLFVATNQTYNHTLFVNQLHIDHYKGMQYWEIRIPLPDTWRSVTGAFPIFNKGTDADFGQNFLFFPKEDKTNENDYLLGGDAYLPVMEYEYYQNGNNLVIKLYPMVPQHRKSNFDITLFVGGMV